MATTGEKRKRGRPPKNPNAKKVRNPTESSCTREIPASNTPAAVSTPPLAMAIQQYTEPEPPSVDDIWKSVTKSVQKQMGFEFLHDDHVGSRENELEALVVPEADYESTEFLLQMLAKRVSLMKHTIHQLYERFVNTEKELKQTKGELEKAKADLARAKLEATEESAKFKGPTSSWSNEDVVRFIESTLGTKEHNETIRTSKIDGSTLLQMNTKLWKDECGIEPLHKRLKLDAKLKEFAARKPNGQEIDQPVLQFSIPEARKEILVNQAEHLLHEMLINKHNGVNGKPQETNKRISPVTPETNNTVRRAARGGGETPYSPRHVNKEEGKNVFIQDRTRDRISLINDCETPDSTRVDWIETPDAHVFQADVPGVSKEEVKIEVDGSSCLRICGERRKEDRRACDTWHRVERFYGAFLRKFKLPEFTNVEGIRAEVNNGVVTVTIPKVPKPSPRVINVN